MATMATGGGDGDDVLPEAELRDALRRLSHAQSGIDFLSVFPLPEDLALPLTRAAMLRQALVTWRSRAVKAH